MYSRNHNTWVMMGKSAYAWDGWAQTGHRNKEKVIPIRPLNLIETQFNSLLWTDQGHKAKRFVLKCTEMKITFLTMESATESVKMSLFP